MTLVTPHRALTKLERAIDADIGHSVATSRCAPDATHEMGPSST